MGYFRKKPVVIEAHQWFKNGDHPEDGVGEFTKDSFGNDYERLEGKVVRFYRVPPLDSKGRIDPHGQLTGQKKHKDLFKTARPDCDAVMDEHGWIDTMEGGHTVCPADWVITGVEGERYPCEPGIFEKTYEPAEAPE